MKELSNEKTTMEWLYWAKEQGFEWADAAIENAKAQKGEDYVGGKYRSLRQSLGAAFSWRYTQEGYGHWIQISNSLTC